jgi:hypothetical protein
MSSGQTETKRDNRTPDVILVDVGGDNVMPGEGENGGDHTLRTHHRPAIHGRPCGFDVEQRRTSFAAPG